MSDGKRVLRTVVVGVVGTRRAAAHLRRRRLQRAPRGRGRRGHRLAEGLRCEGHRRLHNAVRAGLCAGPLAPSGRRSPGGAREDNVALSALTPRPRRRLPGLPPHRGQSPSACFALDRLPASRNERETSMRQRRSALTTPLTRRRATLCHSGLQLRPRGPGGACQAHAHVALAGHTTLPASSSSEPAAAAAAAGQEARGAVVHRHPLRRGRHGAPRAAAQHGRVRPASARHGDDPGGTRRAARTAVTVTVVPPPRVAAAAPPPLARQAAVVAAAVASRLPRGAPLSAVHLCPTVLHQLPLSSSQCRRRS